MQGRRVSRRPPQATGSANDLFYKILGLCSVPTDGTVWPIAEGCLRLPDGLGDGLVTKRSLDGVRTRLYCPG